MSQEELKSDNVPEVNSYIEKNIEDIVLKILDFKKDKKIGTPSEATRLFFQMFEQGKYRLVVNTELFFTLREEVRKKEIELNDLKKEEKYGRKANQGPDDVLKPEEEAKKHRQAEFDLE